MTVALGLAMLILGLTGVMLAQSDRNVATGRQQTNTSLAVAEGAVDRVLSLLSNRSNTALLGRNYDPNNLLGADGRPNSGDEGGTGPNEWSSYDPSSEPCFQQAGVSRPDLPQASTGGSTGNLTGSMGDDGSYTLKAYRYDPVRRQGTLLVEGRFQNQAVAIVAVTVALKLDTTNFPSVVAMQPDPNDPFWRVGIVGLRHRQVSGVNANIYYVPTYSLNPSLTGSSAPSSTNRSDYRNTTFTTSTDGATATPDPVGGSIFACRLTILPPALTPVNIGVDQVNSTTSTTQVREVGLDAITTNTTLTGNPGYTTRYWVNQINLSGTQILTVDTTAGPVQIRYRGDDSSGNDSALVLAGDAKILNIRTDGQTPQVGDLRIILTEQSPSRLLGRSCIQNALLWSPIDEVRLLTTGPGCPGGRNTNFEGVIWAEAVLSSKNTPNNRNINYLFSGREFDTTVTGTTSAGIYVPDDLSSLSDLLPSIGFPLRYQISGVTNWHQVRQ
jgi:hypothetical protein